MTHNKILPWIMAVTGIPLVPFLFMSVPASIATPFKWVMLVFFISLLIFSALESIKRKKYLILVLIIIAGLILLGGLIANL
jgi:hypothetical protein